MKRLLVFLVLVVVSLLVVAQAMPVLAADAGASPDSLTVATGLVVAWGWIAPLTIYKVIPLTDARMKTVTILATVVIAVIALVAPPLLSGGGLHLDLSSPALVYGFALLVYGEQQLVWTLFKDHAATAKLVS